MKLARRILLVEDNPIAQRIPKIILEEAGASVHIADSGHAACEALNNSQPPYDLVLLDIGLPDISGFEVAQHLRKLDAYKDTPVIGLTAHIANKIQPHSMNEIISKPFTQDLLNYINQQYFQNTAIDFSVE
ncbi:MAG: response regulator [Coxiellaceae bacterium]|nr:response regulator [Coxiellaceae bacterium]